MGNVALCASSITSSGVVKVVSSDGRVIAIYTRPVKAAELMLENPGQFVCNSCHLKVGQRIPGVSADEELEARQMYHLLPMEMLYSVLTSEEMMHLHEVTGKRLLKNRSLNFSRIFPVLGDFCLLPSTDSKDSSCSAIKSAEHKERYSRQRSWKPALETILEAPTPPYL